MAQLVSLHAARAGFHNNTFPIVPKAFRVLGNELIENAMSLLDPYSFSFCSNEWLTNGKNAKLSLYLYQRHDGQTMFIFIIYWNFLSRERERYVEREREFVNKWTLKKGLFLVWLGSECVRNYEWSVQTSVDDIWLFGHNNNGDGCICWPVHRICWTMEAFTRSTDLSLKLRFLT